MNKLITVIFTGLLLVLVSSCDHSKSNKIDVVESAKDSYSPSDSNTQNLLADIIPVFSDGDVNAIIEIPAGTIEKWELDKSTGTIKWEIVDNKPRLVDYIGYPGNYGFIPQTLLPKENGGDGDPLDIIVLGSPLERGSVVKCKLIGVLYLFDRGEQDDKLIAVSSESPLYDVNNMEELNDRYKGISEILELWFANYKGQGKMQTRGFGDKNSAVGLLETAINEYQLDMSR
jgi:inorganic pyrophosphatase